MLSHRAKRLQAHKLSAELAAMAPTNEIDYVRSAAAAYDTQEKDLITKTKKSSRQATGRYAKLKQF